MAVNRATLDYSELYSKLEEPCIWYKPRSDFINLTKLVRLVLTKKNEEKEKEESKREQTFGGWVWETIMNIGEEMYTSDDTEASVKGTSRRINMKAQEKKYILGIEVERTEIESTIYEIVKDLSKVEWDWVAMDPEVVGKYQFAIPKKWYPPKDPRPEWRIKETQIQTKEEDAQRNLRKEKLQPKKSPAPEVCKSRLGAGGKTGTPGPAKARHSDNQNINGMVIGTKHSDDERNGDGCTRCRALAL